MTQNTDAPTKQESHPHYPDITVQLSGRDGNAMMIMGAVSGSLKRGGVPKDEVDKYLEQSMSGDYNNVLATAMRWVNVD